ncbi:MAG: hypothetical protein JSV51_07245 [Candidatus Bathyarchaeota archaeon]|nr:MAG: hypothetical protein JSV51_07245 [Candidatus Bathyarchaeota archaeon]
MIRSFVCIAIAWVLLVCYSILLTSVVESLIDFSSILPPGDYPKQILIFLYGLAIVSFLGGSQIPAVFLKKKSFMVQFSFSATFGFMLLLITILNESTLQPLNDMILKPFFFRYPIIALEYLAIPYLFMVFIDFYLSGRLSAFSSGIFGHFFSGMFFHPRRTFKEIAYRQSILFSLVSIVLVSIIWVARSIVFFLMDFIPARWRLVPVMGAGELLNGDILFKTMMTIPATLTIWLAASFLIHLVMQQFGRKSSVSSLASLLGFVFLPSLLTVGVDLLEVSIFPAGNFLVVDVIFFISAFLIPLVLWPLVLVAIALRTVEMFLQRGALMLAMILFLSLFIPLVLVFL